MWKKGCYPDFFTGWFVGWDPKVRKSVMENWESAEKECTSQRSLTLMIGYFPETVACLTYLWHAVLSEGCALKGNTKLTTTDTVHAQMWPMFSGGVPWFWPIPTYFFLFCVDITLPLLGLSKVSCLPSPQLWCCAASLCVPGSQPCWKWAVCSVRE